MSSALMSLCFRSVHLASVSGQELKNASELHTVRRQTKLDRWPPDLRGSSAHQV